MALQQSTALTTVDLIQAAIEAAQARQAMLESLHTGTTTAYEETAEMIRQHLAGMTEAQRLALPEKARKAGLISNRFEVMNPVGALVGISFKKVKATGSTRSVLRHVIGHTLDKGVTVPDLLAGRSIWQAVKTIRTTKKPLEVRRHTLAVDGDVVGRVLAGESFLTLEKTKAGRLVVTEVPAPGIRMIIDGHANETAVDDDQLPCIGVEDVDDQSHDAQQDAGDLTSALAPAANDDAEGGALSEDQTPGDRATVGEEPTTDEESTPEVGGLLAGAFADVAPDGAASEPGVAHARDDWFTTEAFVLEGVRDPAFKTLLELHTTHVVVEDTSVPMGKRRLYTIAPPAPDLVEALRRDPPLRWAGTTRSAA